MHHRSIAILAIAIFALVWAEVPPNQAKTTMKSSCLLQTGSTLRRRVMVKADHQKKPTKKKKPRARQSREAEPASGDTSHRRREHVVRPVCIVSLGSGISTVLLRRETGHDFFETRIAAKRVPVGMQAQLPVAR